MVCVVNDGRGYDLRGMSLWGTDISSMLRLIGWEIFFFFFFFFLFLAECFSTRRRGDVARGRRRGNCGACGRRR